MKIFTLFFLKQILLLGSMGFIIFLLFAWLQIGWFWATDTIQAWLFAITFVGIYLALIGLPVSWSANKTKLGSWSPFLVCLSGPIAVILAIALFSHREPNFYNYFVWPWGLHLIFSIIGLWFGLNYTKFKNA